MSKVLIAMSGGVDSSVVAYLMKQRGHDCLGVTMDLLETNYNVEDILDAQKVAKSIGISFEVFDFMKEFNRDVIDSFIRSYENGETPNPCVACNKCIKFGRLFEILHERNLDYLVTGHYARIEYDENSGRYLLKRAKDENKDQSYVLYNLTQKQLAHILLPLGSYTKSEIREIAKNNGLVTAHKSDSQDICFIKNEKYSDFIARYSEKAVIPGNFVDTNGKILGQHKGIINYTIGQRRGLGVSVGYPLSVIHINPIDNTVVLGVEEDLYSKELIAKNINLISCDSIDGEMRVQVKIRYKAKMEWGTVSQIDNDTLKVIFDNAQRAITKGQSVVLYNKDIVVGGGIIQ